MFDKKQFVRCPKCNEYPKTYGDFNADADGALWRTVTCWCKNTWNEIFNFSHNEHVDTCQELDSEGNVIENITLDKV